MKRYSYLIFLVLVLIVMTGCTDGSGGGPPGYGSIEGYVRYAGSQIPVADALVEIGGRFDYTDLDGFFRMTGLSSRTHTLSVQHPGIRDGVHRQSVTIPSGGTNHLTVLVQPKGAPSTTGDVGGWVYVPQGSQAMALGEIEPMISNQATAPRYYEPLVGATVRIANRTMSTRSDGGFYFSDIQPGSRLLTVDHDSLRFRIERNVDVVSGRVTWVGDYEPGTIVGGIGYYVVVGIGNYPGESTIPGSVANAEKVYNSLFRRNQLAGLGELLTDRNATKSKIQASINRAVSSAESDDDYLVIYFSGLSGQDYLSPSDDPGGDWSKVITDTELERWVRDFPGSVTLIIDGAESNSMADGELFEPFAFRKPEYTVISAAGENEGVFYDPALGSSVFTHFLVQGISGWYPPADLNGNRDITSYELYQYIYGEMDDYLWGDPDRHLPSFWGTDYRHSVIYRY